MISFRQQCQVRGRRQKWRCNVGWLLKCQSSKSSLVLLWIVTWGVLLQYRSSAILAMMPSFNRSLSSQLMSSLRAVSEPGMPMTDNAYTCTPQNCVATPQYFTDLCESGIWQNALVKSVAMMYFHCAIRHNVESTSWISDGWGWL